MNNVEFRKPKQDCLCRVCDRQIEKNSEICLFIKMAINGKQAKPAFCRGCVEDLYNTFEKFIQDF